MHKDVRSVYNGRMSDRLLLLIEQYSLTGNFKTLTGQKIYFLNGKYHREDGPAVEYANGSKFWYLNDERHRVDGPAIECANGEKHWYINGDRHREDGPACEYADGDKAWFLNGKQYYESEYNKRIKGK